MLLPSDRLTEKDIERWNNLIELDEIHSKSNGFLTRRDMTEEVISDFIASGKPYYVAVSWGKDSIVLADLFYKLGAKCKYIYLRNLGREPEGNQQVKKEFLKTHDIEYVEIEYNYAKADSSYFNRKGEPAKWQNLLRELKTKYGCHVTGIRYDESAKRKRRFIMMGLETEYSFAPFRWFNAQDIFAYMHINDLPVHPNYAMSGGGRWDKYRIRVSAIGNKEGDGMGRAEWEKEYYQDILNRMAVRL